jgi:hypothetical protein
VGEVLATVDEEEVGLGRLEEGASLGGQDLDVVAEQRETGQDLGGRLERAGQQQKGAHTGLLPWVWVGTETQRWAPAVDSSCTLQKSERHIGRFQG